MSSVIDLCPVCRITPMYGTLGGACWICQTSPHGRFDPQRCERCMAWLNIDEGPLCNRCEATATPEPRASERQRGGRSKGGEAPDGADEKSSMATPALLLTLGIVTKVWRPGSEHPPWDWMDECLDLSETPCPSNMAETTGVQVSCPMVDRVCNGRGCYQQALMDHVRYNGITQPVCLGPDFRVWDGHHRIVAGLALGARVTAVPIEVDGWEDHLVIDDFGFRFFDFPGATEQALLAAKAMEGPEVYHGLTHDQRRFYRLVERRDSGGTTRFRVTFDVEGNPVTDDQIDQIWENVHMAMPIKDLLAALCDTDERPQALLCTGCGELDPPDMYNDNSHIVLVEDHDPSPGAHDYDGACVTCPIQVQELCGPVHKIGTRKGANT